MMDYNDIFEASLELGDEVKENYGKLQPKSGRFDMRRADAMLEGSIDVHCLSGPCAAATRPWNEAELGVDACSRGMAALVFKCNSYCCTTRSAYVAQQAVDQWAKENGKKSTRLVGGIILNNTVGGLNPYAVEVHAKIGARYVWTPSVDASWHRKLTGQGGGIDVITEDNKVVPELEEIFQIAAKYDMVVGMCHQNTKERFVMIDAAREAGVKRMELIHPQQPSNKMTIDQMKEAAAKGAYTGLFCCDFYPPFFDWDESLQIIKEVGADNIVLGTDLGNFKWPHPIEGFKRFIALLLDKGVPEKDVEKMAKTNAHNLIF